MVAQLVYLTLQPIFLNRHTRECLQLLCGAPVCHVFTFCLTDVTRHMMISPMPLPFHACTLEAVTTSVIHHNDQPLVTQDGLGSMYHILENICVTVLML